MAGIAPAGGVIYGMQLPIQMLSETTRVPWELDATVEDLVAVAQQAEATGQSFVGVCDHIAIPDNAYAAHMSTTWYDTVATLGYLAAHTTSVHLLSVVWIAPYRHPLQTAKSFTTLDHLSGGRVILGVGAGHVEAEFEALGVTTTNGAACSTSPSTPSGPPSVPPYASFSGTYSSFDRVGIGPQSGPGGLPIWVGGSGAAGLAPGRPPRATATSRWATRSPSSPRSSAPSSGRPRRRAGATTASTSATTPGSSTWATRPRTPAGRAPAGKAEQITASPPRGHRRRGQRPAPALLQPVRWPSCSTRWTRSAPRWPRCYLSRDGRRSKALRPESLSSGPANTCSSIRDKVPFT